MSYFTIWCILLSGGNRNMVEAAVLEKETLIQDRFAHIFEQDPDLKPMALALDNLISTGQVSPIYEEDLLLYCSWQRWGDSEVVGRFFGKSPREVRLIWEKIIDSSDQFSAFEEALEKIEETTDGDTRSKTTLSQPTNIRTPEEIAAFNQVALPYFLQGLTIAEIAIILDVPYGRVANSKARLIKTGKIQLSRAPNSPITEELAAQVTQDRLDKLTAPQIAIKRNQPIHRVKYIINRLFLEGRLVPNQR